MGKVNKFYAKTILNFDNWNHPGSPASPRLPSSQLCSVQGELCINFQQKSKTCFATFSSLRTKIWSLADSDRDGMLDEEEFCLAMWVPPLLSSPPAAALAKVFDWVQARWERPALHPTSPPDAALPEVKVSNFWERLVAQTASDRRPGRGSIGSELGSVGGDGEGGSKEGGGGGGGGGGWHLEDQEPQPPPRKRGGSPGDGWAD